MPENTIGFDNRACADAWGIVAHVPAVQLFPIAAVLRALTTSFFAANDEAELTRPETGKP
jgi:hypothetical protein